MNYLLNRIQNLENKYNIKNIPEIDPIIFIPAHLDRYLEYAELKKKIPNIDDLIDIAIIIFEPDIEHIKKNDVAKYERYMETAKIYPEIGIDYKESNKAA